MKKKPDSDLSRSEDPPKLIDGIDYYFDAGLMVLTAQFLSKRGYCCDNGCRHCPYPKTTDQSKNSSSSL